MQTLWIRDSKSFSLLLLVQCWNSALFWTFEYLQGSLEFFAKKKRILKRRITKKEKTIDQNKTTLIPVSNEWAPPHAPQRVTKVKISFYYSRNKIKNKKNPAKSFSLV